MPIRTIVTLAVAVFLGLVAVLLVRNYISTTRATAPQRAAIETVDVVVASQPIDRGTTIEAKLLKLAKYPKDAVPPGIFTKVADLTGADADKRVALRSIAPNEPLLATRVSGPGARFVLSASLNPGMRAVSLRSNEVAGVAGFVLPGDRVDILLTRTVNDAPLVQVLAENVRVLGIDQSDNDESTKPDVPRAVTIEVTPNQAQLITLSQAVGAVTLSLRQITDQAPLGRRAMTVAQLGFGPRPAGRPGPIAGPAGRPIRVTRGVETAEYRVP